MYKVLTPNEFLRQAQTKVIHQHSGYEPVSNFAWKHPLIQPSRGAQCPIDRVSDSESRSPGFKT